jgi:hypothetical protein
MWARLREGRDLAHWRRIHDQRNGLSVEPAHPSFGSMAMSAVQAAVGFVASGFAIVDQAEQERRLAICRACEHYDSTQGRCRICGCVASLKARLASQQCPDNPPRWR